MALKCTEETNEITQIDNALHQTKIKSCLYSIQVFDKQCVFLTYVSKP